VRSFISYGPNLRALVAYLSCCQYIPYQRLTDILRDCFGIKISQGTVDNILQDMKQKSQSAYDAIRTMAEQASVVGGDETGANINGVLHWLWAFQTPKLTYVYCHRSREQAAIVKHFKDGFQQSILVTDRHASYF
jgi:transposase